MKYYADAVEIDFPYEQGKKAADAVARAIGLSERDIRDIYGLEDAYLASKRAGYCYDEDAWSLAAEFADGYVEFHSENGDIWRLVFKGGRTYRIEPEIKWPEPQDCDLV